MVNHLADEDVRKAVATRLVAFWEFLQAHAGTARCVLSLRDMLAWVQFVNTTAPRIGALPAYAHGARLVLLDGLGLSMTCQVSGVA